MFILLGGDVIFAIHQLDCFHLSETPQADYSRLRFQTGGEKGDAEEAGGSTERGWGGGGLLLILAGVVWGCVKVQDAQLWTDTCHR